MQTVTFHSLRLFLLTKKLPSFIRLGKEQRNGKFIATHYLMGCQADCVAWNTHIYSMISAGIRETRIYGNEYMMIDKEQLSDYVAYKRETKPKWNAGHLEYGTRVFWKY
eukprot:410242_1